jgi:hypothetical protein
LKATDLRQTDVGALTWSQEHNSDLLTVSADGASVEWAERPEEFYAKRNPNWAGPPAWVPASTLAQLHSGVFAWDFDIEEMANAQIGIGFMLLWTSGPDWGFFGYLGSSQTAWSYDPSTGDVVTNTASIQGGLPKFAEAQSGVVSVELSLPREGPGSGRFKVNGVESSAIELPQSSVVLPAACFLKQSQRVTLANFAQR